MLKFVFASAIALAAVPALAADEANAFKGPFVGVQGGWQQDRQTLRLTDNGVTARATNSNSGFAYGGQIGYDLRLSPGTVLGGEVALTGRTGTGTLSDGTGSVAISQGRTITATARLGYLIDPQGLLYVRGGYANTRFTVDDGFGATSGNRDGFTAGVGYERMLGSNVSARLEYAYSGFGSEDLPDVATGIGVDTSDVKFNRHAVTAGLNYRF
jgi:outer membrane immunogenic protein